MITLRLLAWRGRQPFLIPLRHIDAIIDFRLLASIALRTIPEVPEGWLQVQRVTLAPPIARRVCRLHPSLYTVFNTIPLLRTHLLAWITKS